MAAAHERTSAARHVALACGFVFACVRPWGLCAEPRRYYLRYLEMITADLLELFRMMEVEPKLVVSAAAPALLVSGFIDAAGKQNQNFSWQWH